MRFIWKTTEIHGINWLIRRIQVIVIISNEKLPENYHVWWWWWWWFKNRSKVRTFLESIKRTWKNVTWRIKGDRQLVVLFKERGFVGKQRKSSGYCPPALFFSFQQIEILISANCGLFSPSFINLYLQRNSLRYTRNQPTVQVGSPTAATGNGLVQCSWKCSK